MGERERKGERCCRLFFFFLQKDSTVTTAEPCVCMCMCQITSGNGASNSISSADLHAAVIGN